MNTKWLDSVKAARKKLGANAGVLKKGSRLYNVAMEIYTECGFNEETQRCSRSGTDGYSHCTKLASGRCGKYKSKKSKSKKKTGKKAKTPKVQSKVKTPKVQSKAKTPKAHAKAKPPKAHAKTSGKASVAPPPPPVKAKQKTVVCDGDKCYIKWE